MQTKFGRNGFQAGEFFDEADIERIIGDAYQVLSQIGIHIMEDSVREQMSDKGFTINNKRVLIDCETAAGFMEDYKKYAWELEQEQTAKFSESRFDGWINPYTVFFEDPGSGNVCKHDSQSLVKMTQFIQNLSRTYGFTPGVPGFPSDVPSELESLARYKIAAQNCRPGWWLEATSLLSAEYMFEMAGVIGQEIRSLPVYVATPLNLGDESFHISMRFKDRVDRIHVTSMPSFGANAPLSINAAYSFSLAEVLGTSIIMRELTGLKVDFHVQMYPFDFRQMNMVFGSPEKLLFDFLNIELNAKLHSLPFAVRSTNIHTWAKKTGIQSAAEKGSLMMSGALLGARYFEGLGGLSLDEIFSPVELVLDCELMQHVSKIVAGFANAPLEEDFMQLIREGLDGSFLNTELTLFNHADYIWYPRIFDRSNYSSWLSSDGKDALEKAREMVFQHMEQVPSFELDESRNREIEELYRKACKRSTG